MSLQLSKKTKELITKSIPVFLARQTLSISSPSVMNPATDYASSATEMVGFSLREPVFGCESWTKIFWNFLLLFFEGWYSMDSRSIREMTWQASGTVRYPAGMSAVVRSMSIPTVRHISILRDPAGKVPIRKARFCWAQRGIVQVARFSIFILSRRRKFAQSFPQKKILNSTFSSFLKFPRL